MISEETITNLKTGKWDTKFRTKGRAYPIQIEIGEINNQTRFIFRFPYCKPLLEVVKNRFEGRKWFPDRKFWHAPVSERNLFQIDLLTGHDPYHPWASIDSHDEEISKWETFRLHPLGEKLLPHQREMIALPLSNRRVLVGADMGLGKTLAAIAALEILNYKDVIWSAPNGPLNAARIEFEKWQSPLRPRFMTWRGTVAFVQEYSGDAPQAYVVDETSYCKNWDTQRTQAIAHIMESVRKERAFDQSALIGLSGKPDPKHPTDWWAQIEALQPGFISEGHLFALQERLGLWEKDPEGGWRKLVTWFDSEDKCKHCGQLKAHLNHTFETNQQFLEAGSTGEMQTYERHDFAPAKNEVRAFGTRLKGIVRIWKKDECLDLPPKQYHMHQVEPSQETLNIAKRIVAEAERGADALVQLRTLSDGFVYRKIRTSDTQPCTHCVNGKVEIRSTTDDSAYETVNCAKCHGEGHLPVYQRITEELHTPKLDVFKELLENHRECGRFVTYAAFQGSVDLLTQCALRERWHVFQADGRAWRWFVGENQELPLSRKEMLERFQAKEDEYVVFIGHAASAGAGITLHRSPSVFFYSCDFNPNNRFQAADRIHRIGMSDAGGHIHDVIHLPSDEKVIRSLINSQNLSEITISELREMYV